jgi:hypothetical protein
MNIEGIENIDIFEIRKPEKKTERTRKVVYEIEDFEPNIEKNLKKIECKYHIFGFYQNNYRQFGKILKGYIHFTNPKTLNKLNKDYFNNKARFFPNNSINIDDYKTLDKYWELGMTNMKHNINKYPVLDSSNQLVLENREPKIKEVITDVVIVSQSTPISSTESILLEQNRMLYEQNSSLIETNNGVCQYLMEQNKQLIEANQNLKNNVTNNITNNIEKVENKTFNINVFLNEECKNAVTLVDFVNSLKIEDADLFCAKERGLAEALSNIFERGLKNYDVNTRPMHCTDTKRDTIHIKEEAGWVKETGSESRQIKNAIHHISNKKISKLSQYIREHPEYNNVQSPQYEDCLKMMRHVMGAEEDSEKTEKRVMKNIAKSVYITSKN